MIQNGWTSIHIPSFPYLKPFTTRAGHRHTYKPLPTHPPTKPNSLKEEKGRRKKRYITINKVIAPRTTHRKGSNQKKEKKKHEGYVE